MLNYVYAVLEAETRIAAIAMGLDPGLGLYHADQRYRDSLACDLMEPLRPAVDGYVLQLLQTRTFHKNSFFENRHGVCRVMPPLSEEFANSSSRWARDIAPVVERVARALASSKPRSVHVVPTPLSGRNRGAGRRRAKGGAGVPGSSSAAKRSASVTQQHAARREWSWRHPDRLRSDPTVFMKEILPHIQQFSLAELSRTTGLSRAYCGRIRSGKNAPHPRHWEALHKLTDERAADRTEVVTDRGSTY